MSVDDPEQIYDSGLVYGEEPDIDEAAHRLVDISTQNHYETASTDTRRSAKKLWARAWLLSPRIFKLPQHYTGFAVALDIVLLIFSILFFALAIGGTALNGQSAPSQLGETVQQAQKLGPSIFPILFAAVTGRSLRAIGRYRAERGVQMSILWQTMNSRTIFETIANAISTRQLTFLSCWLILIWSLSPLGGQATLRFVYIREEPTAAPLTVRYIDGGPIAVAFYMIKYPQTCSAVEDGSKTTCIVSPETLTDEETWISHISALFLQPLSVKVSGIDTWGNLKIPFIEDLDATRIERDGWISYEPNVLQRDPEVFTSLLGIKIFNMEPRGKLQFSLETSYSVVDCSPVVSTLFRPIDDTNECGGAVGQWVNLTVIDHHAAPNEDFPGNRIYGYLGVGGKDCREQYTKDEIYSKRRLRLTQVAYRNPEKDDPPELSCVHRETTCSIRRSSVETQVECNSGTCVVAKMRWSREDQRHPNLTPIDIFGKSLIHNILKSDNHENGSHSLLKGYPANAAFHFLNDSGTILYPDTYDRLHYPSISNIPLDTLSRRLAILVNTYQGLFLLGDGYADIFSQLNSSQQGNDHPSTTTLRDQGVCIDNLPKYMLYKIFDQLLRNSGLSELFGQGEAVAASTDGIWTQYQSRYRIDIAWAITLFVSSIVLVALGTVGMVFGYSARTPNVFDPVMGLTYDNPGFSSPLADITLDATERARLLGSVKVYLGAGVNEEVNREDSNEGT
ncbi:hypothetical protein SAMD00023353_10600240 [Rosellinia necatrix]|uniref:Uncharacterized protein n=1 Tax=Rosellinia necatrix TaxID=77044 RepID=A0A1S7UMC7_ROSNE|nr:hypothetical protein SAMD00023353_10600240 [Rosellinia necatrix]